MSKQRADYSRRKVILGAGKKVDEEKRDSNLSVFCYDIVYISNVSKKWKGKQGETVRGARGESAKKGRDPGAGRDVRMRAQK